MVCLFAGCFTFSACMFRVVAQLLSDCSRSNDRRFHYNAFVLSAILNCFHLTVNLKRWKRTSLVPSVLHVKKILRVLTI